MQLLIAADKCEKIVAITLSRTNYTLQSSLQLLRIAADASGCALHKCPLSWRMFI